MTTSGSTLFNLTRNEFIEAALRKLSVLARGDSAATEDITAGMQALNAVIAELQTVGLTLWSRAEYTFPLTLAATYTIGVGQTLDTPFPLKVNQAILMDVSTYSNIVMQVESIYEYYQLAPGASSGTPIKLYYQPKVNFGTITVWPTPDSSAVTNKQIKLIYQRPLEDFTAAGETMDFPKEWHQAIIYKLADALAPEYGVPLADRGMIKKEAEEHVRTAQDFGSDNSSYFFVPDKRRS